MKNVKGYAIANDGSMKRVAITYDEVDDSGKVIGQNKKANQIILDDTVLSAVSTVDAFVQSVVDNIE